MTYIKYKKIKDEFTTHSFNTKNEKVKVNYFDKNVVSLDGEEQDMNTLISSQNPIIECVEIQKEEFKEIVTDSVQLKRIRDIVKEKIASKYSFADELALGKKAKDDKKRLKYEAFVLECKEEGQKLKSKLGY